MMVYGLCSCILLLSLLCGTRKRILCVLLLSTSFCTLSSMKRKQRRLSRRQKDAQNKSEWDEEHVHKKYDSLCCGLMSCCSETIGHLIAYHALDEDTNYHGLGLNTLQQNVNRNGDTYFFCGGEKERTIGSIRCKECDDGLVRIQSAYEVFDTDNVKEFCRFLKKAEDKTQWRAFKRSLKGTKGIITVDKRLTSNRTIRFEISRDKVQILDDRRNDKCKESSPKNGNVHCNFLIKLFDKWLPVSITYCQGITGYDWFDEETYGCTRKIPKWIQSEDNQTIIIHGECELKYRSGVKKGRKGRKKAKQKVKLKVVKQRCGKCKSLKSTIDRMVVKDKFNKMPSKHTNTRHMNVDQREMKINELKDTVKELKENLFEARRAIGELRETFAISYFESDQAKNDSFAAMIRFVLENFKDVRKGMLNGIDDSKVNMNSTICG
eukprot:163570_1